MEERREGGKEGRKEGRKKGRKEGRKEETDHANHSVAIVVRPLRKV
jgi:hypothetical protein